MGASKQKLLRAREKALNYAEFNKKLSEVLLLKPPPKRCKLLRAIFSASPHSPCKLGRRASRKACKTCIAYRNIDTPLDFEAIMSGAPYSVGLAEYILYLYKNRKKDNWT